MLRFLLMAAASVKQDSSLHLSRQQTEFIVFFKEKIQVQTPKDYPFEIKATAAVVLFVVTTEQEKSRFFDSFLGDDEGMCSNCVRA